MPKAFPIAPSRGHSVSLSFSGNHGYMCNLRHFV